ncbi:MAG: cysteine desulfurase NifS, partial [Verrucomicrobiota bacterium]
MAIIYTDNNATTAIAPEVYEAMIPYLTEQYFNPSSMYDAAAPIAEDIEEARRQVAELLAVSNAEEIIFTSCATESNNTAIRGTAEANPNRRHIITSKVEHPAVLEVCRQMEEWGYEVSYIPVDDKGELDIEAFIKALRDDTLLVTIMHANNETGVIFPVAELARLTKETDPAILFHTDATQSVGKIAIDMEKEFAHVDMLSLSGHKLHAPKGVGALFKRRNTRCSPFLYGGHQENSFRGGTENVPHIIALGKACELALDNLDEENRIASLRDRFEKAVLERIDYIDINGQGAPRLPNTSSLSCHFVEGEGILYQLSEEGICVSSGSACTSGSLEPSHVLQALGVPFTALHGSVRFSFSRYNTDEEIDRIIEIFPSVIANLR